MRHLSPLHHSVYNALGIYNIDNIKTEHGERMKLSRFKSVGDFNMIENVPKVIKLQFEHLFSWQPLQRTFDVMAYLKTGLVRRLAISRVNERRNIHGGWTKLQ